MHCSKNKLEHKLSLAIKTIAKRENTITHGTSRRSPANTHDTRRKAIINIAIGPKNLLHPLNLFPYKILWLNITLWNHKKYESTACYLDWAP